MTKGMWLLILITIVSTIAVWAGVKPLTIYQNFDGPYYVAVAKSWYDPDLIRNNFSFPLPLQYYPAHFPLYPILFTALTWLGLNFLQGMILANLVITAIGVVVIYKIFKNMNWGNPFWIALAWLFWWPRMWAVRSVGSPETLFILCTVASLYFFDKRKYWFSAIAGSLAVLTKSPGILLLITYFVFLVINYIKNKKIEIKAWPVVLIGLTMVGLFYFFQVRTGDFWAYFKTGDNIHLGLIPFRIFDSSQSWVGSWWLEDILWIYLAGGIGVYLALKKNLVWGLYGLIFYVTILFVAHRDIARYSLPIVPVVLVGLSDIFEKKEVRWALVLMIIPLLFYTLNFVTHNTLGVSDWQPLL